MIRSNRDLARVLGVNESAIRKAASSGRIRREPDGSWNLDKVRAQWEENTDSAKQRYQNEPMKPVPNVAVGSVQETLRENGQPLGPGGMSFIQAKTADMILRAQRHKIELERLKESLGSKEEYNAQVFKYSRQTRDMMQNWPSRVVPEMAAELGVDPHLLQIILERGIRELLTEIANIPFTLD